MKYMIDIPHKVLLRLNVIDDSDIRDVMGKAKPLVELKKEDLDLNVRLFIANKED